MNNNMPNLFIVGAAKAGTTSVYNYLQKHKEIFMSPIKEPHYFSKDIRCSNFKKYYRKISCYDIDKYFQNEKLELKHSAYNIDNEEDYLKLYKDVKDERYLGEASVGYLYSSVAAKEIFDFNPKAKIIIILRNPVERAFSHWKMDLKGNDVNRNSFINAIEEDSNAIEKGWGRNHLYVELGLYYKQVKRYTEIFPPEQILITFYEDMNENVDNFMESIYDFLSIKQNYDLVMERHNQFSIPKYPLVNKFVKFTQINKMLLHLLPKRTINKLKNIMSDKKSIKLTDLEREFMNNYFLDDIQKLQLLVQNNCAHWLYK